MFLVALSTLAMACNQWFAIDLECGVCKYLSDIGGQRMFGPEWTADGQYIVFAYPPDIYFVMPDGSGLDRLVPPGARSDFLATAERFAALDYLSDVLGRRVAFATLRHADEGDREYEIATSNLDGTDYKRLTNSDGSDLAPVWSRDGTKIAFVSNRVAWEHRGSFDLKRGFNFYVMDADGSNVVSIAPGIFVKKPYNNSYWVVPGQPMWSPDGAHLAFRDGEHLYTVRVLASGASPAHSLGRTRTDPAWSPDGKWIAFSRVVPGTKTELTEAIFISRPDGSDARVVIQLDASGVAALSVANLSWSADGSLLRFSFDGGENVYYSLFQIGVNGTGLKRIAQINRYARVIWSPYDSRVAVYLLGVLNRKVEPRNTLLYTMAPDGTDIRPLVIENEYGRLEARNVR